MAPGCAAHTRPQASPVLGAARRSAAQRASEIWRGSGSAATNAPTPMTTPRYAVDLTHEEEGAAADSPTGRGDAGEQAVLQLREILGVTPSNARTLLASAGGDIQDAVSRHFATMGPLPHAADRGGETFEQAMETWDASCAEGTVSPAKKATKRKAAASPRSPGAIQPRLRSPGSERNVRQPGIQSCLTGAHGCAHVRAIVCARARVRVRACTRALATGEGEGRHLQFPKREAAGC